LPAFVRTVLGALLCVAAIDAVWAAQPTGSYPNRPIRVVVPFTPGGQPDIVARLIAPRLGETLGQQVVVDNRPGAGGMIGARIVAGANPDGHTLLSVSAAHVVTPAVRANLGYDPVKDFAGITMTINSGYFLVVPPALPVKNVKDLVALAKAKPGQLNFSSAGRGSSTHFAAEVFKQTAAIDVVHVPHRGIPEALTEIMTGRAQFFMAPFASAGALVKEGRMRALGVTTAQRSRAYPDIPTLSEAGVPGFRYDSWGAMFAPAKTPRAIIDRLNREVVAILKHPETGQRLTALGVEATPTTPQQLDKFIAEQVPASLELARRAGITAE
ncbi:MAG TPA: tripartite tricarboxylate transporter substrate binding protein, partial [Burkholderiales bacterium]|nr:tripartite tricarboxylate transporter substrate binding protein [Burkholderiales bacterium]